MVADICSPAYLGAISSRSVLGISASHGPRWGSIWRDGSLNDVVTLFPPLSNPVWAETTQRDQATKYRRPNNTKYKIPRWQQIHNTNYRAGNKYKLQGWQQIQNTELATKPNWINHNPLALQPSFLSSLWSSTYTLAKTICTINFAIYNYI